MGKDRRKDKEDTDEALGKAKDKYGKKGDGKAAAPVEKSFTHQTVRHILVQKQGQALSISQDIHDGKITFNEAAFKFSEDKAGAYGLLGDKAQHELDPDFWAAALTCKEGDWLREPVKTQWGWHLIMVQAADHEEEGQVVDVDGRRRATNQETCAPGGGPADPRVETPGPGWPTDSGAARVPCRPDAGGMRRAAPLSSVRGPTPFF
eukprot:CAMPEP_0206170554 /NCGR_PEP_ID=MMETSP1474-20131121/39499_1 /ASSEMBLY_ACC=CAM_ASM_001110 /TAXON_ID=97495 /ORGANISM="Imantonia sp., Strain RCC918" /LENGTH=205 /DNA_ID=CAMNT_0053577351 /DNA_START=38 /DNA_END=654 /DNA_ORIENTATION=-